MSLLSPLFLVGAALAVVPVVLHLLKRNPDQRVRFAAVAFLKQAPVEHTSRRRLRELWLLALRVTALVVVALAFARPFFRSTAAAAHRATVVVLDTSFSLSAPGRFERAKALARDAVATAPAGDDVAVVAFSDRADVVATPSPDRGLARSAIDAATTGFGGTRYAAGLNAAGRLLTGRSGTIVVVTDLQESGWDRREPVSIPESARVEVRDTGPLPDNLAVTRVRSEAGRVAATVRNTGARRRETIVHVSMDGRAAGQARLSVGPQESAEAVFEKVAGGGATAVTAATVTIDDPQGLQADNVRHVLVASDGRPTLLVVTDTGNLERDAFYVYHALGPGGDRGQGDAAAGAPAAHPSADTAPGAPGVVAGIGAAELGGWPEARLGQYSALVVLSTRGLEPRARERVASFVAHGGGLLIAAGLDIDGEVISDILGEGARLRIVASSGERGGDEGQGVVRPSFVMPADVRHPIFAAFGPAIASLGLVRFHAAARISGSLCQTIARFPSGEAAIVDCGVGEGHAIVIASDLNNQWNDFPQHATFVPFLHEVVRYLSNTGAGRREYLVGETPPGIPPTPGVFSREPAGSGAAARAPHVVVNVDPRESDAARTSAAEFQAAVTRVTDAGVVEVGRQATEQEDRQRLWQYLLALAIAVLISEGVVAARTA